MGTRAVLFLIIFYSFSALACETCHKPHYVSFGRCSVCHRGEESTGRKSIAHSGLITHSYASFMTDGKTRKRGENLVASAGCRRCHKICGRGGQAAASLDLSASAKTGEYLNNMIEKPNSYMPDFRMNDRDRTDIARYLLFCGGSSTAKQEPYTAYIVHSGGGVFEKNCGGCHKIIGRTGGGRGTGIDGPNLSGLYSADYRSSVLKKGEKWNDRLLQKWIKNPRSIKKNAVMPPVQLTEKDMRSLMGEVRN